MTVLVSVDEPGDLTQQALAFARTLGEPLSAFTAGVAFPISGVETLHVADADVFSSYAPAAIARALHELVDRLAPTAVVAVGNERGNEILARLAAMTRPPVRRELHRGDRR